MKTPIAVATLILGWAGGMFAATPLTSIRAIHQLTNAEAAKALPVAFEGTVTYNAKADIDLFVQDGDQAIYVEVPKNLNVSSGDRVLVLGKTRPSFRPDVVSDNVIVLRHGALPKPLPADYAHLIRSELDCMRVTVRAAVRSANVAPFGKQSSLYLELLLDGGYIDAAVIGALDPNLKDLLDAEVEIDGVVSGKFDGKNQLTGIVLQVPDPSGLRVLKHAGPVLDTLPITPMDDILKSYSVHDRTERVRVHGTVTYYQPGSAVVLQDGEKSLWVETLYNKPLQVGDVADATGFPDSRNGSLALTHAAIHDTGTVSPIAPQPVTWKELFSGANAFDLISVDGQVLMSVREDDLDEYVLVADGHLFSAVFRHPTVDTGTGLEPEKKIAEGTKVHITGVSMVYYGSDAVQVPTSSEVLLRKLDDITVLANPSWFTVSNLTTLVLILLIAILAVGGWGWTLKTKVYRQTAALAVRIESEAALERRMGRLEQRRSQILEDINGSRPLAEILEQVTELVAFRLQGAPCWCEVAGGARLGAHAHALKGLRVLDEEIPARSGRPLGMLSVGLEPGSPATPDEREALSAGTKLAALAIETRRLYEDLRRRSECDLLTDIHNRFSFEKNLEDQISQARQRAGIFGLIYVDLDDFKLVNDQYGHRVGDLYLQEVALRMKRQLRSGDMLARLGGDEFAALLPMVHTRADAEEVGIRLERAFDEPISIEGYQLKGSASVGIALYPEDGTTKDSLLSAADAAMYVEKHIRKQTSGQPTSRDRMER